MNLKRLSATALFLSGCFGCGLAIAQIEPASPVQVTIIAVTDFDDASLRDPLLISGIKDATKSLQEFFVRRFGVEPTVLSTKKDTDADHLRTLLFKELPLDSRKTVHLFFFLTHGFASRNPDQSVNKSEIYLATSDTYSDKYVGKAIRGAELIEAFRNMPSRSLALLFLDSCGAGAIDGDNLRNTLSHEPEFASRLFLLASSQEKQDAYSARFSKALANIWDQDPPPVCYSNQSNGACHCGRGQIESFLSSEIKKVPGVSADADQTVRVVAPLAPLFCLESLGFADRLAFLVNAIPEDVTVTLQPSKSADSNGDIEIAKGIMTPVVLAPDIYSVVAKRMNGDRQVLTVDLRNRHFAVQVLFSSDPLDQADAFAQSAAILEGRQQVAEATEARAAAAQIIKSDEIDAAEKSKQLDAQLSSLRGVLNEAQERTAKASVTLAHNQVEQKDEQDRARSQILGGCATCVTQLPLNVLMDLHQAEEKVISSRLEFTSASDAELGIREQLASRDEERERNVQRQVRRRELERLYLSQQGNGSEFHLFEVGLLEKINKQLSTLGKQDSKEPDIIRADITDRGLVLSFRRRSHFSDLYPLIASLTANLNSRNDLLIEVELTTVIARESTSLRKMRDGAQQIRQKLIDLGITRDIVARAEAVTAKAGGIGGKTGDSFLQIVISQESALNSSIHPI